MKRLSVDEIKTLQENTGEWFQVELLRARSTGYVREYAGRSKLYVQRALATPKRPGFLAVITTADYNWAEGSERDVMPELGDDSLGIVMVEDYVMRIWRLEDGDSGPGSVRRPI
jgi:hypothetical protein